MLRVVLARVMGFLAFWVIIAGTNPADLLAGVLAAIIATGVSLRLLPPKTIRLRPIALAKLVLRFLYQSIYAGVDVAWRALDPRLPLQPGYVIYRSRLPPGTMRNAFCTMTSLLPGTLPSGTDESGGLIVHCLDETQPVTEQLAVEEALLVKAIGGANGDG
ncbi:MAG: Na+/H+ antiporter subunit E [Pseudolabrys sp.]